MRLGRARVYFDLRLVLEKAESKKTPVEKALTKRSDSMSFILAKRVLTRVGSCSVAGRQSTGCCHPV